MSRGSTLRNMVGESRGFRRVSKQDKYKLAIQVLKEIASSDSTSKTTAIAALMVLGETSANIELTKTEDITITKPETNNLLEVK